MKSFNGHVIRRSDENSFVDHVLKRRWEVQWLTMREVEQKPNLRVA
jgi:hypothetical protein